MTINNSYSVPKQLKQIELEIKRSKFLCWATNADSRDKAEQFIRSLREQHPKANHVCWAYIAGDPNSTVRSMSDDGEPSGTAGMPMLKVLQHSGLGDTVVAVVRYFGGVKLGTGGLQRAYSDAVAQVLTDLPLLQKMSKTSLTLSYDYCYDAAISRLLARYEVVDVDSSYAEKVSVTIAVASQNAESFKAELVNTTSGNVEIKTAAP